LSIKARNNDRPSIQKPHLFYLPDVPSIPFFPRDAHRHDIEVLEASYPKILAEFQTVYQRGIDTKLGWSYPGPKVTKRNSLKQLFQEFQCVIVTVYVANVVTKAASDF